MKKAAHTWLLCNMGAELQTKFIISFVNFGKRMKQQPPLLK